MEDVQFIVRAASAKEDYDYVIKMCTVEMWSTGSIDVPHVGPKVKPGFFIAELNGERIGCVSVVRHGEDSNSVFFIDFYIIDKRYRGQGYGLKMWNVMWESIDKNCNIGLCAMEGMVEKYKKLGFYEYWTDRIITLSASYIVDTVKVSPPQNVIVKRLKEVDQDLLFTYYSSVVGASASRSFFEARITIPGMFGFVTTNQTGDILGYISMRDCILSQEEKLVDSLFADDINVARVLIHTVSEFAVKEKGTKTIKVLAPVDGVKPGNDNSVKLFESELKGKHYLSMIRMYSKCIPVGYCLKKIFSLMY